MWQHHRRGHHCRVIRTWRHLADQLEDWSRRPNHFQQHCERKDPRPTPRSSVRRALESIIRSWSSCSDSATDHRADAEDGSHEAGSAEDVLHGRHPARVQHAAHRHATCSDSCAHRGRRHHRTQPHDDVDDGAFLRLCCSCVSQLVGVNTRYTGLGRCARAIGALHSSHELCTPARSRIQRRRCLTSTGRSVRTPKTAAKPSTSGLWPISGHVERLVGSVSGFRLPSPTPKVVP